MVKYNKELICQVPPTIQIKIPHANAHILAAVMVTAKPAKTITPKAVQKQVAESSGK